MSTTDHILKINHRVRKTIGIRIGEFAVADAIHVHFKPDNKATVDSLSEYLDIHPDHIRNMLHVLQSAGLITISNKGNMAVTREWKEAVKPEKKDKTGSVVVTTMRKEVERINTSYYWEAADALAATVLEKKIRYAIKTKTGSCTDQQVLDTFYLIMSFVISDDSPAFWHDQWDIKKINSNFNSLVTLIKAYDAKQRKADRSLGSDFHRAAVEHYITSQGRTA